MTDNNPDRGDDGAQAEARLYHAADCGIDREAKMVTVAPGIFCDPCIAPLVKALNDAGIATVASCCGHGHRPGCIALADGREIFIARDFDEARKIDSLFPTDINGRTTPIAEAMEAEIAQLKRERAGLNDRLLRERMAHDKLKAAKTTLTAAHLSDAFGSFWNAALGATHREGDVTANAVMSGMVEGFAAVAARLKEIPAPIASPAGERIQSAQDEAMEATPATGQPPVGVVSPLLAQAFATARHALDYAERHSHPDQLGDEFLCGMDITLGELRAIAALDGGGRG